MFQLAWELWSARPYSRSERTRLCIVRVPVRRQLPCNEGENSGGILGAIRQTKETIDI